MRFLAPFLAVLALSLSHSVTSTPNTGQKCDPKASGHSLEAKQKVAIRDFAHIFLVEKDPKRAFDAYIPGSVPVFP
jgi:hypothetical protein